MFLNDSLTSESCLIVSLLNGVPLLIKESFPLHGRLQKENTYHVRYLKWYWVQSWSTWEKISNKHRLFAFKHFKNPWPGTHFLTFSCSCCCLGYSLGLFSPTSASGHDYALPWMVFWPISDGLIGRLDRWDWMTRVDDRLYLTTIFLYAVHLAWNRSDLTGLYRIMRLE